MLIRFAAPVDAARSKSTQSLRLRICSFPLELQAPHHIRIRFQDILKYTGPLETHDTHRLLQTIVGCAIVADHCFWTTKRNAKDGASRTSRELGLQSAFQTYRSHLQETVMQAIVKMFPEPDELFASRSLAVRMSLTKDKDRENKEKDLGRKLSAIVLNNRQLPGQLQPNLQGTSGSTT
ncbi:hypothetical protein FRB93_007581 [Tulasnella sp. JGI-2019a]|nr:hypothetical protein FRB93_007581 [Tulasnella sp. JGI-2019a]